MVVGFRRSLSLPGSSPAASPSRRRHLRSISLPCRSHPALSHLLDLFRSSPAHGTARSVLDRIDRLLSALDDLLRLPLVHDTLRRCPAWADRLLDGFLRLADAHGSFRAAEISLGDHRAEAGAAIRRGDASRLAAAARSYRLSEKEIARLAAGIKDVAREIWEGASQAEVVGIVTEAMAMAAEMTMAAFAMIAAGAGAAAAAMSKGTRGVWQTRKGSKKGGEEAESAVAEMDEALDGVEERTVRIFKCLVNMRVSLLNILAHSL